VVEGNELNNSVIISDSYSALESIKSGKSIRNDIIHKIWTILHKLNAKDLKVRFLWILHKLNAKDLKVRFLWVPAHVGVKGNEEVDKLAKQTLKHNRILQVPYSKTEAKILIKAYARSKWQEYWVDHDKGRHLYNIQPEVGIGRIESRSRREESIITRLRIGHTGLNSSLKLIGKHPTGKCQHCTHLETVEHILFQCTKYSEERNQLFQSLRMVNQNFTMQGLLGKTSSNNYHFVIKFLRDTDLAKRI